MDSKLIGKRIRERRLELKLTLQQVADSVKVNKSTIQRYESGDIKDIKLPVINSIATYLNVDPLWITGEAEKEKRSDEFERTSHLATIYFNGIMKWSDDVRLNEKETVILREHFQDLLSRYKSLVEEVVDSKTLWENSDREAFTNLYKNRLTYMEIKEVFLKQQLEKNINDVTDWVETLPNWIARNED